MSTYLYKCRTCKQEWEEVHSISKMDEMLNESCPYCDNKPIVRLISQPANRSKRQKNDFDASKMDPTVRKRLEHIKNLPYIEKSTSKLQWGD